MLPLNKKENVYIYIFVQQQKFILLQFWRLEVQSQGVNRAMLFEGSREESFLAFS